MARAYFNKGWLEAVADLQGAGERFVVSPYVTEAALHLNLKRGDRLLTQNRLGNFITGSSDLLTLKELIGQGIDVRSQDRIHAKVYMGVFGHHAVGWLGSANLTQNGRSDGRQVEAMAGPFLLERDFIESIEESWGTARHFDPDQVRHEIEAHEANLLQQNMFIEAVQSVVALHVRFTAGLGRCTLRPKWLGIDTQGASWKGVMFPSVPYLTSKISGRYRALKDQAMESLISNGGYSLGEGMYLIRASLMGHFEQRLIDLRTQLLRAAQNQLFDLPTLRSEFAERFGTVFQSFVQERNLNLGPRLRKIGIQEALQQFDTYMAAQPFELSYAFFAPLLDNQDYRLIEGIRRVLQQPYQAPIFAYLADLDDVW